MASLGSMSEWDSIGEGGKIFLMSHQMRNEGSVGEFACLF